MTVGRLIVFEGIDKSGKETQSRLLTNYLRDRGHSVAFFSFPSQPKDNEFSFAREIQEWLHGRRPQYNQYVVNMLYTQDRFMHKETLEQCLRDYDYTILDRYYYSNWIYGSFMENVPKNWLQALDIILPKPDMVFLLDIPGKLSVERRGSVSDIHESKEQFIDECRKEYTKLGWNLGWTMIDGSDLPEKIHRRICTSVDPLLSITK